MKFLENKSCGGYVKLFAMIALTVLVGCGGGGGSSDGGSSSSSRLLAESVSIADFNVVSTITHTEAEIREKINSQSAFYNNFPSTGGTSARSECIDDMEDQSGNITKDGNYYRFSFEKDIKDCNSDSTSFQSEIMSRLLTYWSTITNGSSNDLTQYTVNSNPSASSGTYLSRWYREIIYTNNNKYILKSLESKESNPSSPCEWTTSTRNDCEYRRKFVTYYNNDLTTVTGVELVKYNYNNVVRSGGTYYASGSMEFRIENWSGVMTFNGSSTPSTYTASDGSQTITGTLGGQTSVSLYINNSSGSDIQNVFISASENDDWGSDKLILPTLSSGSVYIGEIGCNQSSDFRVDFYPTTLGEHKKYNYYVSCSNSKLTWNITSTSVSSFTVD